MARKANLKKGMKGPQKMRYQMGGDFMEPNKELKFGGLYEKGGSKRKKPAGHDPNVISPATSSSYRVRKKDISSPINEKMKGIVQNASAMSYNSTFGDKGQYQPPMSITSSMLKSLAGYGAESRASMGAAEVKPKKKQKGGPIPDGTTSRPGLPQSAYSDAAKAAAAKYGPSRGQGVARPTSDYMAASDKATGRSSAPAAKPKSSGFSDAFAAARKAGKTTFTYNGKSYGTRKAGETQEQYRASLSKAGGSASSKPAPQPMTRKGPSTIPQQRPAPTIQKKAPASNYASSSSSNKKQLGGMMKGNKATAKPPMKPMGKKNNTKTTKL